MRIGVFDSGIGGLTVLEELVNSFPNNQYIYLADMLNSPFGDKTEEQIREITRNILDFMRSKDVDVVICACGTISGVSIDLLGTFTAETNIPVFEMTEGIRQALVKSNSKHILLLATSATIKKGVFEKNISYSEDVSVIPEACPEFVKLIESEIIEEERINEAVEKHLSKMNESVDSIVLGCTHYGLLKYSIKKYALGSEILDAGRCLVNREDVRKVIKKGDKHIDTIVNVYTTKITGPIDSMSKEIFGVPAQMAKKIKCVSVE